MFKKLLLATVLGLGTISAAYAQAVTPVNVNTASVEQLTSINGIGVERAKSIIAARQVNTFSDAKDLRTRVKGIGEKNVETLMKNGLRFSDAT